MARPTSKFPTELELLILKYLWKSGPQPVRRVRQMLEDTADRSLAHTSVVTTLNTMVKKAYLKRELDGNAYIFEATVDENKISSGILNDILHRIFDGSAKSLFLNLLDSDSVSSEDHEDLRDLIEEKQKQTNKKI